MTDGHTGSVQFIQCLLNAHSGPGTGGDTMTAEALFVLEDLTVQYVD